MVSSFCLLLLFILVSSYMFLTLAQLGTTLKGVIKIFDFGLAKELPTINNDSRNVFHMTGMCGSPRYVSF
jgi:serine/threonine protein kinase